MKDLLEKNKYYPMIHVTDCEYNDSRVFNRIMDMIIALPTENDRIMFVLGLRNSLSTLVDIMKPEIDKIIEEL